MDPISREPVLFSAAARFGLDATNKDRAVLYGSVNGANRVELGTIQQNPSGDDLGRQRPFAFNVELDRWPINFGDEKNEVRIWLEDVYGYMCRFLFANFVHWGEAGIVTEVREIFCVGRCGLVLEAKSPDSLEGYVGQVHSEPIRVVVVDDFGSPVPEITIHWSLNGWPGKFDGRGNPGAKISPEITVTDNKGEAWANLTLGRVPGKYTIEAKCSECLSGSPQIFTAAAMGCEGLTVFVSPGQIWPSHTGGNSMAEVAVGISKPAPPGGCLVRFEQPVPIASTGHDHGVRPSDLAGRVSVDSCLIPENGITCGETIHYLAPEIAGQEMILALLLGDGEEALASSSTTIAVRVPELSSLSTGARLTTFTSPEAANRHRLNNSNFGTGLVNAIVTYAVQNYFERLHVSQGANLAVIDMSLPEGGVFDLDGQWTAPHHLHRLGKSVDFSKYYRTSSGDVIAVNIFNKKGKVIRDTPLISDDLLDFYFAEEGCVRKEKTIGKIHYECP